MKDIIRQILKEGDRQQKLLDRASDDLYNTIVVEPDPSDGLMAYKSTILSEEGNVIYYHLYDVDSFLYDFHSYVKDFLIGYGLNSREVKDITMKVIERIVMENKVYFTEFVEKHDNYEFPEYSTEVNFYKNIINTILKEQRDNRSMEDKIFKGLEPPYKYNLVNTFGYTDRKDIFILLHKFFKQIYQRNVKVLRRDDGAIYEVYDMTTEDPMNNQLYGEHDNSYFELGYTWQEWNPKTEIYSDSDGNMSKHKKSPI